LVEANSKIIALAKLAPLRNRARATATAAYEQEELTAPRLKESAKPLRSGRPRAPATARFETTVWTTAERRNPKASGQKTSQSMNNEIWSACRMASITKNPS
jgi:hypothetical protein